MTNPLRRAAIAGTVAALALAGVWIGPMTPRAAEAVGPLAAPPYRVCPVAEAGGGFSSRLGLYRDGALSGRLSAVGEPESAEVFNFNHAFAHHVDVAEFAELGLTPLLVESDAAGGVYNRAGGASAVAGCTSATAGRVALLGMATNADETSVVVLSNPFGVEAAVQLEAASEFGIDTPTDLEQVRIPAATTLELDLNRTLAGREMLSVAVSPLSGSIVAGMRRGGENDVAVSEAISGGTQWYFAVPDFGIDAAIHLRALTEGDTAFRIDRIGSDVLADPLAEGTVTPQAEASFALADLGIDVEGFVVTSDQPVAAAIVYVGEGTRAVSAGIAGPTSSWVVPVSSTGNEGQTGIWILNTTDRRLTATVAGIETGQTRTFALPPGATTGTLFSDLNGSGALVDADGPVAVFYGVLTGSAVGISPAIALE